MNSRLPQLTLAALLACAGACSTQHARLGRTVEIGVEQSYSVAHVPERDSEVYGDG